MLLLLASLLTVSLTLANTENLIPDAEKVIGKRVPDVILTLEGGIKTSLKNLSEGKPLLISFIYTKCTSACPLIVDGIKEGLKGVVRPYKVVLIDFDERDTVYDLRKFREERKIPENWLLAKAENENLRKLTEALDFKYVYDRKTDMFYHSNVLVVLTPELKVSSYFLGVKYSSKDLSNAIDLAYLGATSESPVKGFLLRCFRYNPVTGKYEIDWSFIAMIVGSLIPISLMFYFIVWKEIRGLVRRFSS